MYGEVVDRDDVGVRAAAGRLRFVLEAGKVVAVVIAAEQIGADQLDRHVAVDHRIMRLVDHSHGAAPEHAFDAVAADRGGERVGDFSSPVVSSRLRGCAACG